MPSGNSGEAYLDRVGRRSRACQVLDPGDDVSAGPRRQEVLVDLKVLLAEPPHAPGQQGILFGLPPLQHWHIPSLWQ